VSNESISNARYRFPWRAYLIAAFKNSAAIPLLIVALVGGLDAILRLPRPQTGLGLFAVLCIFILLVAALLEALERLQALQPAPFLGLPITTKTAIPYLVVILGLAVIYIVRL
jgi:hypothetical protein